MREKMWEDEEANRKKKWHQEEEERKRKWSAEESKMVKIERNHLFLIFHSVML